MLENGSGSREQIRIWVIAPSPALRAGLRAMLASDERLLVSGESATFSGLSRSAASCDVIVLDNSSLQDLPGEETGPAGGSPLRLALQGTLENGEVYPALLLLSDDPQELNDLLDLPLRAWGLLPLDSSAEELIAAVQSLDEGLLVAAPHLLSAWLQAPGRGFQGSRGLPPSSALHAPGYQPAERHLEPVTVPLTPRETEVLQRLAQGLANKQIALALGISEHTIKFHVSSIYAKLGVGNRTEAVRVGARQGLILL
jgi:DNA-binding NarL/FixJ family response regulator